MSNKLQHDSDWQKRVATYEAAMKVKDDKIQSLQRPQPQRPPSAGGPSIVGLMGLDNIINDIWPGYMWYIYPAFIKRWWFWWASSNFQQSMLLSLKPNGEC